MKEDIKNRWIAALTSGEYVQTHGWLHDKAGFCCLGVLCDLHRQETGGVWVSPYCNNFHYNEQNLILPDTVRKWAGIKTETGRLPGTYPELSHGGGRQGSSSQLSGLNDRGYSFAQLGELIEKHWGDL